MPQDIVSDSELTPPNPPYPLYRALEQGVPLENLLLEGRWLESSAHDCEAETHMHWYRRVLKTYDSETQTVLLSQKGSRRLTQELETPDREYTFEELERDNGINGMTIRPADHELY